jgi:hypothetical protein
MVVGAGSFHTVALKSSYHFGGFFGSVNAAPIVNTLQAGAGVPVRFSLGGSQGLGISLAATRFHAGTRARPDASPDEIERTVKVDVSSLRPAAQSNTYTYV